MYLWTLASSSSFRVPKTTAAAVIEESLWEIDFAERNGFESVWLAEHHLSGFGLVSAPSVFAAAIAARTTRMRIGYGVAVVPLHQPIRLAEEIAWLTHLSGGRVVVGVGPGFSGRESRDMECRSRSVTRGSRKGWKMPMSIGTFVP